MSERRAGLYLHVPFCATVCPYCDFAVRTGDRNRRRRFVDHLLAETELYADYPLEFDTIYFGGGTPSLLDPEDVSRILDAVRGHLRLAGDTRLFLEANPEDVTDDLARAWRQLGIHTLSLGVQSLDPGELAFLGRRHGADAGRRAVEAAHRAGFDTVSIDLIYGLPGQRPSSWRRRLDEALALEAHHISCYQLTIHEKTRFALLERRGELTQLTANEQGELFFLTHRHLEAAGLEGYEVSQFAVGREHRSRHNLKYWDHTPYLGLGPSAHSFREPRRWWNIRRTDPWQERVSRRVRPVEGSEVLDARALVLESLMTGLRTHAGVDLTRVRERWGVDLIETNGELVERLASEGLVTRESDRLIPTLSGLAVADAMAPMFAIPAPAPGDGLPTAAP